MTVSRYSRMCTCVFVCVHVHVTYGGSEGATKGGIMCVCSRHASIVLILVCVCGRIHVELVWAYKIFNTACLPSQRIRRPSEKGVAMCTWPT